MNYRDPRGKSFIMRMVSNWKMDNKLITEHSFALAGIDIFVSVHKCERLRARSQE
jgi:hypothetical protein